MLGLTAVTGWNCCIFIIYEFERMALNTVAASSHTTPSGLPYSQRPWGPDANFTLLPFWIFEIVGLGEDLVWFLSA